MHEKGGWPKTHQRGLNHGSTTTSPTSGQQRPQSWCRSTRRWSPARSRPSAAYRRSAATPHDARTAAPTRECEGARGKAHPQHCPKADDCTACSERFSGGSVCCDRGYSCCGDDERDPFDWRRSCIQLCELHRDNSIPMWPSPKRRGQTKFIFGPLCVSWQAELVLGGPAHIATSQGCDPTNERDSPPQSC